MDTKSAKNIILVHSHRTKYSAVKPAGYDSDQPLPPQNVHPSEQQGSFDHNDKDNPQLIAGACIISTGGMSMAWSVGFHGVSNLAETKYMNVCWFAMAIAGAMFSAILTNTLKKKNHMILSSVLVVIGGILFISFYDNFVAIMAARHLNGFAVGWILVTTFIMVGEEAGTDLRSTLITTAEAVYFSFGIVVQIVCSTTRTKYIDFDSNQMHGLMVLFFGFTSFVVIIKQAIEFPEYSMKDNPNQLDLDSLLQLERPCAMSAEKHAQSEEYEKHIASASSSCNRTGVKSMLFKLCLLRGIIGLSFTAVVTRALHLAAIAAFLNRQMQIDEFAKIENQAKSDVNITVWLLIVYAVSRFSGTFIGSILQDPLGSKLTLTIGMFFCGSMTIGIAILFSDLGFYLFYPSKMLMVLIFLLIYQFFTGMCITSSSAYLAEAFPLTAKPYCIAIILTTEMTIFIVCGTIKVTFNFISQYFYALGIISYVFVVLTVLFLPETKRTSLRDALHKFENIVD